MPFVFFHPNRFTHQAELLPSRRSQFWLRAHEVNFIHRCSSSRTRGEPCEPYEGLCIAVPKAGKAFRLGHQFGLGHCPFSPPTAAPACDCRQQITGKELVAVGLSTAFVAIVGLDEHEKVFQYAFDLSDYQDMLFFNPLSVGRFIEITLAVGPNKEKCRANLIEFANSEGIEVLVENIEAVEFQKPVAEELANFEEVVTKLRTISEWKVPVPRSDSTAPRVPTIGQKRTRSQTAAERRQQNEATADGEGPLPAGWRSAIDVKSNQRYYYNNFNQKTWIRPRSPAAPLKSCLRKPEEPAPNSAAASSSSSSSSSAKPAARVQRRSNQ